MKRLDASDSPPELVRLVRRCLSSNPDDRPDDASVVARIVNRYFEKQDEDERSGEIKLATRGERRKKKVWLIVAGLAIAMGAIVTMGLYIWYEHRNKTRLELTAHEVQSALDESIRLQKEAAAMPVDTPRQAEAALAVWQQALAQAEKAESLLKPEADAGHRSEVEAAVASARERVKEAKDRLSLAHRNEKLLADLPAAERTAAVRLVGFRPDFGASKKAFAKAFRDYGVDVLAPDPGPAVQTLKLVPEKNHGEVVRAIDYWAVIDAGSRLRLREVADRLDDNRWRQRFRRALDNKAVEELVNLAATASDAVAAGEADILGDALRERGRVNDSVKLLSKAQLSRRGDYWIQMSLGISLCEIKPSNYRDAAACFKSALSVEEKSAAAISNYALTLMRMGEIGEAVAFMRKSVELQPDSAPLRCNLAVILNSQSLGNAEAEKEAAKAQ